MSTQILFLVTGFFVFAIQRLWLLVGGGIHGHELQRDYYIPCLTLPAEKENKPIGLWGQRHKRYLQEHKRAFYATLLTSGKLNAYLADVDKQAEERFERIVEQMKQAQGITERLKAKNALEWVGQMNNIRACAMEIVEREIIFA